MPQRKSGDVRRRWEIRVLVALPAVWVLFAVVQGVTAIQMTLAALGDATPAAVAAVDRVRLLIIGVGSLIALFFGGALALAVTRPMRELLRKIQHRLRGDAAIDMSAGNELRQLSNAFDSMLLSFDKFVSDTSIANGMPLGILVVDKDDTVMRANAEAHRVFGTETLEGTSVCVRCAPGRDRRLAEALKAVRTSGSPVEIPGDVLWERSPGDAPEPSRLVMLHPTSTIGEVVFVIRDLGHLATIRGQMQRVDQLAALGAHVASLAHEIGGGLMGIQMLIEAIEPRTPTETTMHDKLRGEVERATRLLAEIRTFGQASARARVPCNLGRLVEEILWMLEPRYMTKGLAVHKRLDLELPPVRIDRDRVVQAILNVVNNAFEATPSDGIVTVSVDRGERANVIRVANTGSFIPPGQREQIFTLFYTAKRGGSGFGLPQARRALVDHGGDIEVTSSLEEGTEFTLSFPDQATLADPSQRISQPSATGGVTH